MDKLNTHSTGATASCIQADVIRVEKAGAEAKEAFIETRLKPNRDFFEPIKLNLKEVGQIDKSNVLHQEIAIQFKQPGDVSVPLLFKNKSQDDLNLDLMMLMAYSFIPVPFSIGTTDE